MAVTEKQPYLDMNFPEDILTEILLKLPVKSLLRFSCVCKKWRALFRGPWFGDKHLNNYCYRNDTTVVFIRRWEEESINEEDIHGYADQLLTHHSHNSLPVLSRSLKLPSRLRIRGSCNGILYLSKRSGGLAYYLCNPITQEYMTLPAGLFGDKIIVEFFVKAVGFGFDRSTDDYKIIRVVETLKRVARIRNQPKLIYAEIYKLSTNCWSKLDVEYLTTNTRIISRRGVFTNGSFHWWCREMWHDQSPLYSKYLILTFDFYTEIFGQIECPDTNLGHHPHLGLLDDSLAFLSESEMGTFDVWVMMEYGNKNSWTKKCSIGPSTPSRKFLTSWNVLTSWKDDQRLLLLNSDGQLISCLMEDCPRKIRIFEFGCCYVQAIIFQPTLVSLSRRCSMFSLGEI